MAQVRDGSSNTYMLGEKYLNPDDYLTGNCAADNRGMYQGQDFDVNRWAGTSDTLRPRQDNPAYEVNYAFGSAHSGGYNTVLCDGSVRTISYSIDQEIHRRLGNRKDGQPVDASRL